jgi:hypothetical protein
MTILLLLLAMLLSALPPTPASAEEPPAGATIIPIGQSIEGNPIQAIRFGSGPRHIIIVGAIHGNEANTAVLVNELVTYYSTILHLLPPDVSLTFIPVLNPDGLDHGSRYNARGVDLNRNWDSSDWQPDATGPGGRGKGTGGIYPFSEPETAALAGWLLALQKQTEQPITVLFYHSAYPPSGLVLTGSIGSNTTRPFARVVGYSTSSQWGAYSVTGTAVIWCREHGFQCFETELPSRATLNPTQTQRHATAILSVLLLQQTAPDQRCFAETGYCISGRLRDFWEDNGGTEVFGLPLTAPYEQVVDGIPRLMQVFQRHRLDYYPEHAPPYDVQPGRLGVAVLEQQGRSWWKFPTAEPIGPGDADTNCQYFAETRHRVCGPFLQAWRSNGIALDGNPRISEAESIALFGLPLSEPQTQTLPDGQAYTVQWFERARLEHHPAQQPEVIQGLLGKEYLE